MFVFDSSTIILLTKTEILDILFDNYEGDVAITKEVERETTIKKTFDALFIKKRVEEGKIKVREVQNKQTEQLMNEFNINRGEAESIVLALREKNSILGTDDKNAINACKLLHISYTTAIGILIRAREKNLLAKQEAIKKLNELSGFGRYRKEIIDDAEKKVM